MAAPVQAINVNLEQAIIEAIVAAGFSADKFPTEVILTSFYLPVRIDPVLRLSHLSTRFSVAFSINTNVP